jgi:3-hydroxyisobutyrate dehydrogenase-like beta-hydroxyacid dehydrogenase
MRSGAFAIECSTVSYGHVTALAAKAQAAGLRFIDCPVNGAPTAAAEGKLTLLVGASAADLEAARPLLAAISTSILHFGAIGSGSAFKLINNLYGAVQIAGLAEAVALANRIGLDKEVLIAAVETGPCASPHVKRLVRGMVESRIADMPGLSIGLREKDARYSLAMAQGLGAGMAVGQVAHRWYATAKPMSGAEDDSALVATVAARNGQV